jgi:surface carbohydrate biosynthesis protein
LRFLWRVLKLSLDLRSRRHHWRVDRYLDALIAEFSPKVIVSLADSNKELLRLATRHPEIKLVLVQTAIRASHETIFSQTCNLSYCAFGKVEQERLRVIGKGTVEVIPTGSLVLSTALEEISHSLAFPRVDLGYVSSFRISPDPSEMGQEFENMHQKLFSFTAAYAKKGNYSLRVLAKSKLASRQKVEREFFTRLANGKEFDFVTGLKTENALNSYHGSLATDLIVTMHSTLGFEILSLGRKVIFGSSMRKSYPHELGINDYFSYLPSMIKMETEEFEEFCSKMNHLMEVDVDDFALETLPLSRSLISRPLSDSPEGALKKIILQGLN